MHSKKICFFTKGGKNWIAGSIYLINIIKAIQKRYPEIIIILIVPPRSDKSYFDSYKSPNFRIHYYSWRESTSIIRKILAFGFMLLKFRKIVSLEGLLKKYNPDFIYPSSEEYLGLKSAFWIPDLQHRVLPEFFPNKQWNIREYYIAKGIKINKQIVVSSYTTLSHLKEYYNIENKKIDVLRFTTYLEDGIFENDPLIVTEKFKLPEKFFIFSSNFWKHKNHKNLFESLIRVKEEIPDICLVLTGALIDYRNPEYKNELLNFILENGLTPNIKILGLIDRNDQIQLLRQSVAIIQPSYFEGWSALVEDARAVGKTIILSDIPVHREQKPFEGIFFNPHNIDELSDIIINKWKADTYGPDREKERLARIDNEKRLNKLAEDFINITD